MEEYSPVKASLKQSANFISFLMSQDTPSLYSNSSIGINCLSLSVCLSGTQVIPGIESVLEYMQPGGEVTCTIPAKYAYGEKGICIEVQYSKWGATEPSDPTEHNSCILRILIAAVCKFVRIIVVC